MIRSEIRVHMCIVEETVLPLRSLCKSNLFKWCCWWRWEVFLFTISFNDLLNFIVIAVISIYMILFCHQNKRDITFTIRLTSVIWSVEWAHSVKYRLLCGTWVHLDPRWDPTLDFQFFLCFKTTSQKRKRNKEKQYWKKLEFWSLEMHF